MVSIENIIVKNTSTTLIGQDDKMDNNIVVFIPTYNERENVEKICTDIFNLGWNLDILFLDDNSPDGTGEILDQISNKHSNVHVIHRAGKLGIWP